MHFNQICMFAFIIVILLLWANLRIVWKSLSCVQLFASPWNSPGQKAGMDSLSLIQEIFPTQGWNPDLPHCRQILYQLSHKGSPGILDWVSYPFSRGPSQPRNRTRVSCVAGGFFTSWAFREAPNAHCEDCVGWYYSFILFSSHFYSQVEQFFNCLLSIWMSSLWSALCAVLLFYKTLWCLSFYYWFVRALYIQ